MGICLQDKSGRTQHNNEANLFLKVVVLMGQGVSDTLVGCLRSLVHVIGSA